MQVTVTVKEDNSLNSALEKRMSLLERVLAQVKNSDKKDTVNVIKALDKSREKESATLTRLTDSFLSAVKKLSKPPKIQISQRDSGKGEELGKSINARFTMLEKLLNKNSAESKELIKGIKPKIVTNNVIMESIKGSRVMPSPS